MNITTEKNINGEPTSLKITEYLVCKATPGVCLASGLPYSDVSGDQEVRSAVGCRQALGAGLACSHAAGGAPPR